MYTMANFQTEFERGQEGKNVGLTTGIRPLDIGMRGIQKNQSIGVAAAPKCGKTKLCDFAFLISPFLYLLGTKELNRVNWIYLSYEIDRVTKEYNFAAYFMFYEFNIFNFEYNGITYEMSGDYLRGRLEHIYSDNRRELIKVTDDHKEKLIHIYKKWIIPIFGRYDEYDRQVEKGIVTFIQEPDNPTGVYKMLMKYARDNGQFIEETYQVSDESGHIETKKRIIGYVENNPNLQTIVIADHIRKFKRERGFTMKENIDKWLEYSTWFRKTCLFTFINVCHSNRGITNVERLKFAGENIFPTADDIKDTGNLAEESTILMTLFNPNDEKYNLEKHMGIPLQDYPNYRSLHITESRDTPCPTHIQLEMFGNINLFRPLKIV